MTLVEIQKLQFSDLLRAQQNLLAFLREHEDPSIENVELTPRPESLNSLNGFLSYDNGERLFFKTHVEENEKLNEYYNFEKLRSAGYPLLESRHVNHRPGKQIALYEIIKLPTLFDMLKIEEDHFIESNRFSRCSEDLLILQQNLDKKLTDIYAKTLTEIDESAQLSAPIQQLFYRRLKEDGRLGIFYRKKELELASNDRVSFEEIAQKKWIINGVSYEHTLEQIIERSRSLLKQTGPAAIVGHGDAHNGNIFVDLQKKSLYMFDPAFAGTHSPLLDFVKPTFHNVFARWMYFPEQVSSEFQLEYRLSSDTISINHDFKPSALRLQHLNSRIENLLKVTLSLLKEAGLSQESYNEYLRSAFFCCPLLTVNLFAVPKSVGTLAERYSLKIKLLALSLAVIFGTRKEKGDSQLDSMINQIFEVE